MTEYYYFSIDGTIKHERANEIIKVTPKIGDFIRLYSNIDFEIYFPDTSYLSPDNSWCYINQYLMEITESLNTDGCILSARVIGIL